MPKYKFHLLAGTAAVAIPLMDEHGKQKKGLDNKPLFDTRIFRAGAVIETDIDLEAMFNSPDRSKAQKVRRIYDGEVVGDTVLRAPDLNQLSDEELAAKVKEMTGVLEQRQASKPRHPSETQQAPPQPQPQSQVPGTRQPVHSGGKGK